MAKMRRSVGGRSTNTASVVLTLAITLAISAGSSAQTATVNQVAGVDNSRMGSYRALAQLAFLSFDKGDLPTAAKLARILERTWDKGEEGGGSKSLLKTDRDLFILVDEAMDQFVQPLIHPTLPHDDPGWTPPPDPIKLRIAYDTYLEKLKMAD